MPQSGVATRAVPTSADWEARRETITRLYVDKDETLAEVMAVVNQQSIFEATPKMYKDRIRKWGLDKKIKEHEARAILHLYNSLKSKSTEIRLRGRRVDVRRIEHYFHRKGVSVEDVLSTPAIPMPKLTTHTCSTVTKVLRSSPKRRRDFSTSQGLNFTASSSDDDMVLLSREKASAARPQYISSPASFKIAESIFADVHEYVLASFNLGYWVSRGSDEFCRNQMTIGLEKGTNPYRNETRVACLLFDKNEPDQAKQKLLQGFAQAKTLVHRQAIGALPYIIESLAILLANRKYQFAHEMLKHLTVAFGLNSNQTTLIFKRIFWMMRPLVYEDGADGFLLAMVRSLIGSYEKVLGPSHLQTIKTVSVLTRVFEYLYGPVGLDMPLNSLYQSMVQQYGPQDIRSLLVLLDIADIQLQCCQYSTAEATAYKVVEGATSLVGSPQTNTAVILAYTYYYLLNGAEKATKFWSGRAESSECDQDKPLCKFVYG
ncbi:MAG: hypothetical protein Q9213_001160 [Squamulea squamosa]